MYLPTKKGKNTLRKYFKNERRLELLLVLQRFARWYFVGAAAAHYAPRYPSNRQWREHREYIAGLGGIDAYHKLIDSIVPSSDLAVFDEADVPWDVDSEDCLFYPLVGCYDGGDGY